MGILAIIGTILEMCGIILIYDARSITKKRFIFEEQNKITHRLKIIGFIICIIGGILMMV